MAPVRNHQPLEQASVHRRRCMGIDRRQARRRAPPHGSRSDEATWEEGLRNAHRHRRW